MGARFKQGNVMCSDFSINGSKLTENDVIVDE